MFALFMVGFSLMPFGLLLLFWNMFPEDHGVHPIYRKSGVNMEDKKLGFETQQR